MYQLVFKGECADGIDMASARNNARTLFKASVEQVDRMFSGQPVVIRNKLEEVQAEKYRAVLKKHGMIAYVEPMPGSAPAPQPAQQPQTAAEPAAQETAPSPAQPTEDTPAASTPARATGGQVKVEPGERLPVAGEKVDSILSGSGLTLDPVGVTMEEHQEVAAPEFEHLDDWSIAPPGTDLGVERDTPPPPVPDVSHLSLADDDASEKS